MRDIRVLLVSPAKLSFTQTDMKLLRRHFQVRTVYVTLTGQNLRKLLAMLFDMAGGILWADVTLSWFAGWHSLWAVWLSKLVKKKSIVIAGGSEVTNVSEIGREVSTELTWTMRWALAWTMRRALKDADRIIAVSEFNRKEILEHVRGRRVDLVFNGIDCSRFKPCNLSEKDKSNSNGVFSDAGNSARQLDEREESKVGLCSDSRIPLADHNEGYDVVTAALFDSWHRVRLKGIDTFVESAALMPDVEFVVIGGSGEGLKRIRDLAPSNVAFIRPSTQEELIHYYQRGRVYCQLSCYESFGLALAEAMSCGCVPVATRNGALPEVVGDTGFYVQYGDSKAVAAAIENALLSGKGKQARDRITKFFSIERREADLVNEILQLIEVG